MSLNKDFSAVNSDAQEKEVFKSIQGSLPGSSKRGIMAEHYTEGRNDCKERTEATENRMKWKDDP